MYVLDTAWRKVLKGAWLTSKGPYTKWYSKIGGQKEAISDFKSLKPTHVVTVSSIHLIICLVHVFDLLFNVPVNSYGRVGTLSQLYETSSQNWGLYSLHL